MAKVHPATERESQSLHDRPKVQTESEKSEWREA